MTLEAGRALVRIAVALLVGLLIGLDRERAEQRKSREIFGGIRTFPLIALAGAIPMLLIDAAGPWLALVSFAGVVAICVIAYWRGTEQGHIGATTEAAGIATFLAGALAGAGELLISGVVGLAVTALLVSKPKLEALSRAMTPQEVTAVLELAFISGIILPIAPDRGYGPWGALNPREIWMVVVLVAGLSFMGFVAMRLLGENRGLVITGAVGGLVSSTAVTVAMADRSKESNALAPSAAAAAVLASSIMALRILVLVGLINRDLLPRLLPACLAMALTGAFAARVIARADKSGVVEAGEKIRNPFSLRQAVIFAAIYALITLAVRATQQYLSTGAMFATAAVGSVADVDAVSIALARLGPSAPWREAAAAITLAAVMNTLVKLGIGRARGSPEFGRSIVVALGLMALAGVTAGGIIYLAG